MRVATFWILLAAVQGSHLPARGSYSLKERHYVPPAWTRVGPAPKDHVLDLHIGLKSSQFAELERHLLEISNPSHTRYGQHLTAHEVNELIKPTEDDLASVLEWLTTSSNVPVEALRFSPAKDFIYVSLPVEAVEKLLDTKYSVFEREGAVIVRTPEWSLPHHLHGKIDMIQPTTNFMRPTAQARKAVPVDPNQRPRQLFESSFGATDGYPNTSAVCDPTYQDTVEPACIRTLYGTIDYKPKVPTKNSIALTNFDGEVQARLDVRTFLKLYRPDAVSAANSFSNVIVNNGPKDPEKLTTEEIHSGLGKEGALDAETIISMSYPIPLTAYSTGGRPPFIPNRDHPTNGNEPYLPWLQYVLAQSDADIPYIFSISYADDEQTVPPSYATKVCSLFAQLGARGVSVFVASGDFGIGSSDLCQSNDGKNTSQLIPSFPASCPYVTTVGGTQGFGPEQVAFDILFSAGSGFSNYFPRPSYQDQVVQQYIKGINGLYNGYYNKTGRAYPDLAATSLSFAIVYNNATGIIEGTSASTPVVAGIFALLNDVRLAAGKKPLGFINPLLYSSLYQGFHDITNGSNPGCGNIGNGQGFPAKKGWDGPSGWGSPNFQLLKDLVLKI